MGKWKHNCQKPRLQLFTGLLTDCALRVLVLYLIVQSVGIKYQNHVAWQEPAETHLPQPMAEIGGFVIEAIERQKKKKKKERKKRKTVLWRLTVMSSCIALLVMSELVRRKYYYLKTIALEHLHHYRRGMFLTTSVTVQQTPTSGLIRHLYLNTT